MNSRASLSKKLDNGRFSSVHSGKHLLQSSRKRARHATVLGEWQLCRHKSAMFRLALFSIACTLFFSACAGPSYTYRYVPGKTATLENGYATAPPNAPDEVKMAIAAGNRIAGSPYAYGGGHGRGGDGSFDCSGAVSHVLQAAGKLGDPMPSRGFRRYGRSGEGKWLSVYARKGHVFLVAAGLRFDTGWHGEEDGPRWTTRSRPARGYVIRHPPGL